MRYLDCHIYLGSRSYLMFIQFGQVMLCDTIRVSY